MKIGIVLFVLSLIEIVGANGQELSTDAFGNPANVSKSDAMGKSMAVSQAALTSFSKTMSYQGLLTTGLGTPVADGLYDLQFDLYDSLSGGTSLWSETQTGVAVQRGTFNVNFGSITPLTLQFIQDAYVNVIATNGPAGPGYPLNFAPRSKLTAAPYSLAPWVTNSNNIFFNNGAVGIGTANPSSVIPFLRLEVADSDGNHSDIATRVAGTIGGYPVFNFAKSRGTLASPALVASNEYLGEILFKAHDGTAFRDAAYILARVEGTPGVADMPAFLSFATSADGTAGAVERMRISNNGNVGIGTSSPFFPLHVRKTDTTTTGLQARVSNSSTFIRSYSLFSLEANNGAVVAQSAVDGLGTGLMGTPGGYFGTFTSHPVGIVTGNVERIRIATNGYVGIGTTTPSTILASSTPINNYGYSQTDGTIQLATYLNGSYSSGMIGTTSNHPFQIYTSNLGPVITFTAGGTASGMVGIGTATPSYPLQVQTAGSGAAWFLNQSTSGAATGLWGYATGSGGSTHYGVYGYAAGATTNYAGYFLGNVSVTGTLTKGGGAFKIDHPLDPANKYLYHSFVESPDMKNIYDGVALLDGNGQITVELPAWFEALNKDFRYQLTAIGGAAPNIHVSREISRNTFSIAGGTPGLKVSWQVTGIRKDAYANSHRIPVEEAKRAEERGKYLYPTENGAAESMGIDYQTIKEQEKTGVEKNDK